MPILGIDLRSRSSQVLGSITQQKTANATVNEIGRPTSTRNSSMDHIKRPTIPGLGKKHSSQDKERKHSKDRSLSKDKMAKKDAPPPAPLARPFVLNMAVESPPALFLDSPSTSSGYLLSGRLQVTPTTKDVVINRIAMYLEATIATKKPVTDRCRECESQVKDLYEWKFFSQPKTFLHSKGMQELPFSHLIPGHLPTTTHGHIGSLDYSLHVRAYSSDGTEIQYRKELNIKRALRPGNDKNSVRIFPTTPLSLHVTLPSVIHPIGSFSVQCRMTGILAKQKDVQNRWRVRKITWKIEEQESMVSPACSKHSAKVGGEGKGVLHEQTRDVGTEELKGPFKHDFESSMVEGEFEASLDANLNPQCDVESAHGLKITHALVLELVISEEWAPNKKPNSATPTGHARVLRTQFALNVTERQGMGISWDDEMPPVYEDLPPSPPHYANQETRVEPYEGEDLHADVEQLQL